jgi:hypothetical protein
MIQNNSNNDPQPDLKKMGTVTNSLIQINSNNDQHPDFNNWEQ